MVASLSSVGFELGGPDVVVSERLACGIAAAVGTVMSGAGCTHTVCNSAHRDQHKH